MIDFPYVGREGGGGGQPTYGKFHMFRRFFKIKSIYIKIIDVDRIVFLFYLL